MASRINLKALSLEQLKKLDFDKLSAKQLDLATNLILSLSGCDKFGNKRGRKQRDMRQDYFESQTIIMTPMGNRR